MIKLIKVTSVLCLLLFTNVIKTASTQPDRNNRKIQGNHKGDNHPAQETTFMESLLNIQKSSPLVQMIAEAVSKRIVLGSFGESDSSVIKEAKEAIGNTTMETALHLLNNSRVESIVIPFLNKTNPGVLRTTLNQIGGELGEGSKFMEGMPSFAEINFDAASLTTIGAAGALAMMAVGAMFAVPVPPIILRRQGPTKKGGNRGGWGGLPSFTDLFSWFDSDDEPLNPNYIDYANDNYYDQFYEEPHEFTYPEETEYHSYEEPKYQNDPYSNNQRQQTYEDTSVYERPQSPPTPFNDPVEYDTSYQLDEKAEEQHKQYYSQPPKQHYRRRYTRPKKAQAPHVTHPTTNDQNPSQSYQVTDSFKVNNQQNRPRQRVAQRRTRTHDGYTYVSLNQVNKIADESLNSLVEHYEQMQKRRYDQYVPEENEITYETLNSMNSFESPQPQMMKMEPKHEPVDGNFFTEEDAVVSPKTDPVLKQEQDQYVKAYQTRYTKSRTPQPVTMFKLTNESEEPQTNDKIDRVFHSTKEFPYEYLDS